MTARFWQLPLQLVVLASIASTSCVPNVLWQPDSSGIIYTTTNWPGGPDMPAQLQGRLMHYHLKTKAARVIAKTETNTIQPALSPDGKQIAVARIKFEKDKQPKLQVVVYDLEGKETHRSKLMAWGEEPKGDLSVEKYAHLFWAPHENKVLVYANKHSGVYNLDQGQAVMLGEAVPSTYGTTPVRPDGKGFLLAKNDNSVAFLDWDGKETAIAMPTEKLNVREQDIISLPAAGSWSRWEGPVAIATWKAKEWRVDTVKKTAALRNVDKAIWALDGKEIQQIYAFAGGKTKLAVLYLVSPRDFHDAGLPTVRVDFIGPEPDRRRTLIQTTPYCGVYPSPNQELVALRYTAEGNKKEDRQRDMILVVNQKGEVVADIDTGK
jgi:hypothetical protein